MTPEYEPAQQSESTPTRQPATRRERHVLDQLQAEHDTAIEVYLDHVWQDAPIDGMEADFENLYWASYERIDHFIDDQIDAFGWDEALEDFTRSKDVPSTALVWDRAAILQFLSRDYDFYERDGLVHVFVKRVDTQRPQPAGQEGGHES